MKNFIIITPFLVIIVILFCLQHVASLSPIQQKVALFQFKQSLNITTTPTDCYGSTDYYVEPYRIPSSPKTMNWSMSSDHCTWEGVSCQHETGHVIGLDLSCSQLEGAILPNSTLFQLSHLRFLNLSWNDFSMSNQFPQKFLNLSSNNFSLSNHFPQEFSSFAKGLTHLNLSRTGFTGRVPLGISHLYKLVSLDLSYSYEIVSIDLSANYDVKLDDEVFKSILQNLTQLRILNLDGVNISSVLPVNLSTSLRVLSLRDTGIHGVLPQEVFHLPNIVELALGLGSYEEPGLQAVLPKVKWGSSGTLQHLFLGKIHIYGGIPDSIGFLESLVTLELGNCNLSGPIPRSIGNLGLLTYLGLGGNNLTGPIPKLLANLTNMRRLSLNQNNFTGPFLSSLAHLAHFKGLIQLDLSNNGFTGLLPTGLFNHPSLEYLDLSYNGFTGQLYDFNSTKSQLEVTYLHNNLLYGPIPQSFSQLVKLSSLSLSSNNFSGVLDMKVFSCLESLNFLDLSSNNFSGVLDMKVFSRLEILQILDLSHNSLLSVRSSNTTTIPPKLEYLDLSSCNMKEFPHFSRDAEISLSYVDLSDNEIHGEIPHWIGSVGGYLNISYNRLTGGLEQLPWNNLRYLDLQSNRLNGSLPTLICNSSFLGILNLSNNTLSGVLPICRKNLTALYVFDMRMNNIQGSLPSTLSNFRNLRSINLHGNKLGGRLPPSFAEFYKLETLDLGSNQINDTFPQCLEALPNLRVLVLKSNKFYGFVNSSRIDYPFPSLRIFDLSNNEFSGPLPAMYFKNFKAMMNRDVNETKPRYLGANSYSDSTSLVIKGVEIQLVRILTTFTTIDVSSNNFEGKILDYIGNLVSLKSLNFSYNHLTGHIPPSIGKLSGLESLDLSSNQLEGEIPQQLTGICWLARLNLSCNQLSGQIPKGPQFDTYDNDSYIGNFGLCGPPLSKKCENNSGIQEEEEDGDDYYFFSGFTWEAVVIGYGCGVVPAFIIGYMMLLAGKPKWFAGIIARELGLKIRRMEIKWR